RSRPAPRTWPGPGRAAGRRRRSSWPARPRQRLAVRVDRAQRLTGDVDDVAAVVGLGQRHADTLEQILHLLDGGLVAERHAPVGLQRDPARLLEAEPQLGLAVRVVEGAR